MTNTHPRHRNSFNNTNFNGVDANGVAGGSQYRWVLFDGGRKGEDVMLSNVLAFDVRVYDPSAPIWSYDGINPVQAGDAGAAYVNTHAFMKRPAPSPSLIGTGAYVDFAYGIKLARALQ